MRKRKIALFIAVVMTLASVCPVGNVVAEDVAAIETTMEVAGDATQEEEFPSASAVAVDGSAADIVAADIVEEQTSASGEILPDDQEEQLFAEPETDFIADQNIGLAGTETLPDNATAAEVINGDDNFIVDISAVNKIEPIVETGIESGEEKKTIESITFSLDQTEYEACPIADILYLMPVTVSYKEGGSEELETFFLWPYSDASFGTDSGQQEDLHAYNYSTDNGDTIWLAMWKGAQMVDISENAIQPGEYELGFIVNGQPWSGERTPITIKAPQVAADHVLALNTAAEYKLQSDRECVWYSYTVGEAENGKEVLGLTVKKGTVTVTLYKDENGMLNYVGQADDEEGIPFTANKGEKYLIGVQEYWGAPPAIGEICISAEKTVKSAKFTLDKQSYDTFEAYDKLTSISAEITYDSGVETIDSWEVDEDKEEYDILYHRTKNGNTVYLKFISGDELTEAPINILDSKIRPGTYTLRLFVGETPYKETDQTFTITPPTFDDEHKLSGDGTPKNYDLQYNGYEYFEFKPTDTEEGEECVIKLEEENDNAYMSLYTYADGDDGPTMIDQANQVSRPYVFLPKSGISYIIVIRGFDGRLVNGTIRIEKKAGTGITSAKLLEKEASYNVYDAFWGLRNIKAELTFANSETPDIIDWWETNDWYGDEEFDVLCHLTENGDKVFLAFSSEGQVINMPISRDNDNKYLIWPGTYTANLVVDGELLNNTSTEVTIVEPEATPEKLNSGVEGKYELAAGGEKWYSFTPGAADAGKEFTVQNKRENGYTAAALFAEEGDHLKCLDEENSYTSTSFVAEEGKKYLIAVYECDGPSGPASGSICIKSKAAVEKVELELRDTYDLLTVVGFLKAATATITYASDSEEESESVSSWDECEYRWGDESGGALNCETAGGNVVYLTFWTTEGKLLSMPTWGEDNELKEGKCVLKAIVDDEVKGSKEIELKSVKVESLPASVILAAGEEKHFSIETQRNNTTLAINMQADSAANVSALLFHEWEGIGDSLPFIDKRSLISDGNSMGLETGRSYRLVVSNNGASPVTLSFSIIKPDHIHRYEWITTEATCTQPGKREYRCECNDVQETEIIPATGHTPGEWKTIKEATCTETGEQEQRCTVCETLIKTNSIPTKDHSWGEWETAASATIEAPEKQQRICTVCGAKEEKTVGEKLPSGSTGDGAGIEGSIGTGTGTESSIETGTGTESSIETGMNSGIGDSGAVQEPFIELNATSIPLKLKQSTTVIKVEKAEGDSIISWTSSNKKVATVSKTGKIKAKKKGTTVITVTLASGKTASVTVKVQKNKVKTKSIKGVEKKLTLEKGKKYKLKPMLNPLTSQDKLTYTSSDKKVATVDKKGNIKAKKKGTAEITVKSGKKSVVCKVTVK